MTDTKIKKELEHLSSEELEQALIDSIEKANAGIVRMQKIKTKLQHLGAWPLTKDGKDADLYEAANLLRS